MKVLITGAAGFIGHHVLEHVFKNTNWEIITLDRLSYAAPHGYDRLRDIDVFDDKRVRCFSHDLTLPILDGLAYEIGYDLDFILHLAAETHVDNSIINARPFVMSNVLGTMEMLEFARTQKQLKRFLYFSTDEVFGPASPVRNAQGFSEWHNYNSGNPYAATKAGGEELALAYQNTFNVPVIITHTMNNFGERQHPEKYLPLCINKILAEEVLYVHSDSTKTRPGSRFYLHARNAADAVLFLLTNSQIGEKYNIVGDREIDNLQLAQTIEYILDKPLFYEKVDFHSSRPGHDLRYALNGFKLASMGWHPPLDFDDSLEKTVQWYISHPKWLQTPNLTTTNHDAPSVGLS